MIAFLALLIVGAIFTLAGWFGPEDEGVLAMIGIAMIGFSIYVGYKAGAFPPGTFDFLSNDK